MAVRKRLERAAEYRRMALAATALMEASPLANVREKHERAATRWWALAALDERPGDTDLTLAAALPPTVLHAPEKDDPCTA